MLDLVIDVWKVLPREHKQAILLLLTSIPLGIASIIVGLRELDYLLAMVGIVSLLCAVGAISVVGFVLLSILYALLRLLLSLPIVVIKWAVGLLRKSPAVGTSAATDIETTTESQEGREQNDEHQRRERDGFDLIDWGLLAWFGAAILQIVLLAQKFAAP